MSTFPELHNNQQFVEELRDCATQLSEKLSGDDMEGASELIGKLIEVRDRNIFNTVGKLTRALHDAIVSFNVDGDLHADPPDLQHSEIKDASDRLQYVIEMTRSAADKTMDIVEASSPLTQDLGARAESLQQDWQRLGERRMSADEFRAVYRDCETFFGDVRSGTAQLHQNLQGIVLEQGFQDLTGQVLQRVISLICDVEESLVNLMRIAGQVEEITGLVDEADKPGKARPAVATVAAEGPQIHAGKREDVVSGQDEVDDLLSSLGF